MTKNIKTSGIVALVLGLICLSWVVFDIFAFDHIRARLHVAEEWGSLQNTLGGLVWIGYFVFFLFHIAAFLVLIFRLQYFKKTDGFQVFGFLLGLLSFFSFMGDYGLLNDIGKETKITGEPQSEWSVLYVVLALHALFILFMLVLIFHTFREMKRESKPEAAFKDEILFITAQWIGVFCGAAGLWVNYSFLVRKLPGHQFAYLIPFYMLILLPYGLTALSWLFMQRGEKPASWYDEKQWQDMTRAALATILLSIPGMALLFLIPQPLAMFWFPHYIFLLLFLFSGSTLIFTFRQDSQSRDTAQETRIP